jgi:tetratricopeptide (TPR) repeat protein
MRLRLNVTQVLGYTALCFAGLNSGLLALAQPPVPQSNRVLQPVLLRQCPIRWPAGETSAATIQSLQQEVKSAQLSGNQSLAGSRLNSLGDIYRVLGRYDEAVQAFQQSIAAAEAIDAPLLAAASWGGLSHTYVELGDYAKAETGFGRSLQLRKAANSPGLEALALNNRGIVRTLQGQFEPANADYQQGLTLISATTAPGTWMRLNRGNVQYFTQGATVALATYDQVPVTTLDVANKAALLNNRGLAYQALGQFDQALQAYDAALKTLGSTSNTSCQWRTLSNRGRLLAQQGKFVEAVAAYQQATTITTQIWQGSVVKLSPQQQKSYRHVIRPIYQELALLLIQQGKWLEAQTLLMQISLP